jgi:energy-coupling factor transporter ATP-binding protein EcfA2
MAPVIEVKNLWHRYPNGFQALRGINVAIDRGEFVAIVGQNGSGKTTFVKHMNSLLRATIGTVHVDGLDVSRQKVSEMARRVGYCFQNPDNQIFCETVYKEVAFGPQNLHLSQGEVDQRVEMALGAVGLLQVKENSPRELSKGQRKRLAVAAVLSMQPEILIVDEPTTGQDFRDGMEMLSLVQRLHESGHTVLIITHDMLLVARFAKRVLVLREGQIVLDGTPRNVFGQPDLLRSTFLAPPPITTLAQALPEFFEDTVLSVDEMVDRTMAVLMRSEEVSPS